MNDKIPKIVIFCVIFFTVISAESYTRETDGSILPEAGQKLGWIPSHSICKGYFSEPPSIASYHEPLQSPATSPITVESTAPVFFQRNSWSTFSGPLEVSQPGRLVTAQKGHIYQDPQTGQPTFLILDEDVHFYEPGRHIVTEQANFDLSKRTGMLGKSFYRVYTKTPTGYKNAIGEAEKIIRPDPEALDIVNGTYSTCPPTGKVWEMKAKTIKLNQATEWGTAKKIKFYFKHKRIFSFPYFTFPMTKKRKTGFLIPYPGASSKLGAYVGIPYYFNLAPNYDETLTFIPSTKRTLLVESEFRYLTRKSQGQFFVGLLPYDPTFHRFISTSKLADFKPYLVNSDYAEAAFNRLKQDHATRAFFHFEDSSQLNLNWKSDLHLNYVTDDYYFQDVAGQIMPDNTDQMLNRWSLEYSDVHWDFSGILQAYQTLHPVNQPVVDNIYKRVPQLNLNGQWFDPKTSIGYQLNSEIAHFELSEFAWSFNPWLYDPSSSPYDRLPRPTGTRFHLAPQISWQKSFPGGFFKPAFQLDLTAYELNSHYKKYSSSIIPIQRLDRTLPIFSIDTGLYLDKPLNLNRTSYTHTLEPRFFYLYVPYKDQLSFPNFDTILPPASFNQLYRTNRFIGMDRISNANQVTLGLTSRLLDLNGVEKLQFNLGQIYYFNEPRVFLEATYPYQIYPGYSSYLRKRRYSPLVQELKFSLNPKWDLFMNTSWNLKRKPINIDPSILDQLPKEAQIKNGKLNDTLFQLSYRPKENAVINAGYEFIRGINYTNVDRRNINRLKLSASYPVGDRWNILGAWHYNIRPNYTQNYLAGLEYNDCCWAVRFIFSQELTSEGETQSQRTYNSGFFIQFQLKGLGNFGLNNPDRLLPKNIPGYQNQIFGE